MDYQSDAEITQGAMTVLKSIFHEQDSIPDPIKSVVTRWGRDEFAMGSYSSIPVTGSGEDYDIMARCVGSKVFWAGEATCRQYPATVHGSCIFVNSYLKELC